MANIFTAEDNQKLRAVSTQTANENVNVKYEIYLLKNDAASPVDGICVGTIEKNYRYAGFHRENLDKEVFIQKGQKYSIVVTQALSSGNDMAYEVHSSCALNQNFLNTDIAKQENITSYNQGVVNKGESYLSASNAWIDWSDITGPLSKGYFDYDNFSIKGYSDYATPSGLALDGDVWHYYSDGIIDTAFEGFATNAYGIW